MVWENEVDKNVFFLKECGDQMQKIFDKVNYLTYEQSSNSLAFEPAPTSNRYTPFIHEHKTVWFSNCFINLHIS